ncbi:LOW QUALITY PROTEIN: hypothetical protein PFNF135_06247 [Plasmodium falciparum NF135/5.C10]|uniref:Uncharacterized protein n=1 Tax=Plasmodium falciparum NF135/5.C10 TaxID=1036726 RepID=W4I6N0_PLAFA|nr:LOW QUALITY PROTEIN: hypothetical protein PFNF135_06247 [Plasmodium falciparum NF135/5.C10]
MNKNYFIIIKIYCYFHHIILEYILGYSFDKYHERYHYIYVVYTHKNYCSTHWYIIYNTEKKKSCL